MREGRPQRVLDFLWVYSFLTCSMSISCVSSNFSTPLSISSFLNNSLLSCNWHKMGCTDLKHTVWQVWLQHAFSVGSSASTRFLSYRSLQLPYLLQATLKCFVVVVSLHFPEFYIKRITWYAILCIAFFILIIIMLRFIHVDPCYCWLPFLWMNMLQFVYPFTCW